MGPGRSAVGCACGELAWSGGSSTTGATVPAIAAQWGFAHRRFSADYRTHYGHPPGHTLPS